MNTDYHVDGFQDTDDEGNVLGLSLIYEIEEESGFYRVGTGNGSYREVDYTYHTAKLCGCWIGDAWLGREFFLDAWGSERVAKLEHIVADGVDGGRFNHARHMPPRQKEAAE